MKLAYFITERCNKKCEYCDVPTIENPQDIDLDLFLRYSPIINENPDIQYITLTGGEPGLLDEKTLETIIENIRVPINVNTNGEFIRYGYYDRWKDRIRLLDYHVIDSVDYEIEGRYVLVNYDRESIAKIKKSYPSVNFEVREVDNKIPGLVPVSIRGHSIGCFVAIKEIDWVNGYLLDCCKSITMSPRVNMTVENLDFFMKNRLAIPFELCKGCSRPEDLYGENIYHWIRRNDN